MAAVSGSKNDTDEKKPKNTASTIRTADELQTDYLPKDTGSEVYLANHMKYGWRNFRPDALQYFNNAKWLLFFLCLSNFSQTMATNGFIGSVLSTLETRFGLKSTQSALIASAYEIGTVPALVIISIFGSRINRPLWIGLGMFVCSLGSFLFVMPHYFSDFYQYSRGAVEPVCKSNSSVCDEEYIDGDLGIYLYVFIIGNVLHGIGTTPLYTIGVTYLDDMISKETSALFIGIFYAMGVLGPAVGFIGGGFFLNMFTDFDSHSRSSSLSITNQDPRWVGAWWVGFWINAIVTMLVVLPLTGFPLDLPGAAQIRAEKESEAHGDAEAMAAHPDFGSRWRDVLVVILSLFKNAPFVCITFIGIFEAIIIQGFVAFGPKYVENQFAISSTLAAIVFGIITVPGGAGGTVIGGYIIKRFKMGFSRIMKINLIMHFLVVLLMGEFFIRCPSLPYAGINTTYNSVVSSNYTLLESCNAHCGCSEFRFEPICGQNNIMYYSPCHAGCLGYNITATEKNFYNCSCIPTRNQSLPEATSTVCESDCTLLPLFLVIFFITMFFTFFASICSVNATLRVVSTAQKSNGIAFQWIFLRLLGAIPAPLIFGATLDSTCILWDTSCDSGTDASCLLYDSATMGHYMLLICGVMKTGTIVFVALAWKLYKPPTRKLLEDSLNVMSLDVSTTSTVSTETVNTIL